MNAAEKLRFHLLRVVGALLRLFGFRGMEILGNFLGSAIWRLVPKRRAFAVKSIQKHLGLEEAEASRVARESFRQNGRSFLEILLTGKFGMDSPRLRIAQPELMERLCLCDRPIVATTAHFGSWELLASILGQLYAPPRPRVVVVRRYGDAAVRQFIATCREATGATMIGHRKAALPVIRALHKKGIVAFLVDHNTLAAEARFLPFLGEIAAVNAGPALLALRAKAMVWPVCLAREGKNYVFLQRQPLDTATLTGNIEENIRTVAEFYTRAVESFIREYPEQWFWMHERWKTRPPSELNPSV